jgi:hypothetical protein
MAFYVIRNYYYFLVTIVMAEELIRIEDTKQEPIQVLNESVISFADIKGDTLFKVNFGEVSTRTFTKTQDNKLLELVEKGSSTKLNAYEIPLYQLGLIDFKRKFPFNVAQAHGSLIDNKKNPIQYDAKEIKIEVFRGRISSTMEDF